MALNHIDRIAKLAALGEGLVALIRESGLLRKPRRRASAPRRKRKPKAEPKAALGQKEVVGPKQRGRALALTQEE